MRCDWNDERTLEEGSFPRERNNDSSLQAQYEDSVLPDREWEHEEDS